MTRAADLKLDTLTIEQEGAVVTARFSSPPFHFATIDFVRDLDRLTAAADEDASVRAVILTGGVDGKFLTHADPAALGDAFTEPLPSMPAKVLQPIWKLTRTLLRTPRALGATDRAGSAFANAMAWGYRWRETILRMNRSSVIYIAAINGTTTGGGHEIALACDLRFVSDAPGIGLGQIEILAGLIPGGGGTQRLPRMIGTARALEHMLEGTPITAQQALELGIVNAVIPDGDLVAHAQKTAARLARRSSVAVQAIKQLTYFATSEPIEKSLDLELAHFLAAGLQKGNQDVFAAFGEDLAALQDSPLSTGNPAWVDGTRIDFHRYGQS
ncbi:hypothetical protein BOO86_23570 [Mycobacterium sp. CBMA 234]|uniref:enoyl-CoA hydratase/isomerase family protein n=1 Tax=Mycolicibacterium sp. CBMA 234 TaxID=1918495 RepID=UPI0012DF9633|nr:enoyl-CoA hydratase/isomerase family protein [Mycolicibacterium sp. CBMA 234]MUL67473.1 hypothetical protein [Mycolicibacterium sp. CBMA 234]